MVVRNDIDNSSALLTVTVTREELKPQLDAELKKFRNRVPIKGFRAGHTPIDVVKKLYGSAIFSDTLNDLLSKKLYDFLRQSGLEVLGQPLPSEEQRKFTFKISDPEPEYAVTYEVGFVPSFEINGLEKSASFEKLVISNLDELAEQDLEYARNRMGKRSNPEDDIQGDDIVRIASRELEAENGEIKEGGWETTITLFLKDMTDEPTKNQLLSAKKGDTLRFNARTLENHEKDEMYRKYILNIPADDSREVGDWFEGTIEEVSRVEAAALDQEFFEGYFGSDKVNSKEEALEQFKKGIQQFYDVRSNALLMRAFQERLMRDNPIELPEKFLKRWLLVSNEGKLSEAQLETEFPYFIENLRWTMLREKIMKMHGLKVTEADIVEAFKDRVRSYFQVDLPEHIINNSVQRLMENEKEVEKVEREIETDKIFAAIRDQVTVTERAIPSDEFHNILDAATQKAEAEQLEAVNEE